MTINRQITESPLIQGADERVAYSLDTTPWGGYTSGAAVVLKDENLVDVSVTNLSGAPSVVGNVITTPLVISLTPGDRYRLEILWVYSGNTLESWAYIDGEL